MFRNMSKADQNRTLKEAEGCKRCTSCIHKEQQCRWRVAKPVQEGAGHKDHDHSRRNAAIKVLRDGLNANARLRGEHKAHPGQARRKRTAKNLESHASTTSARTHSKSGKIPELTSRS